MNSELKKQCREAYKLLKKRLKANKLKANIIKNKKVLDMGCENGRYSYALKKLGARYISAIGNLRKIEIKGIDYQKSKITKLFFKNNEFDFVFCNGQLSHEKNWKSGLKEAYRVLKPKGYLWLSLYGKGKIWEIIKDINKKLNEEDKKNFEKYLKLRDWEQNKIKFLLNSFFSKDKIYFTKDEIKKELIKIGFNKIYFLERGIKTDLNEKIFKNPKLKEIYGEGEIRLITLK